MKKENSGSADSASKVSAPSSAAPGQSLVAGRDYYLERGMMVFTAEFLRRRGYCCESGCRHCPYSTEENK